MKKIFEVVDLEKSYGKNKVLKKVNFSIFDNERIAIVGGNGSGKTTLLNIISGNDKKFKGNVITDLKYSEMSFQFQNISYPDSFSIFDLLYLFEKKNKDNNEKTKDIVNRKLKSVGLLEKANLSTINLSGGQLQKLNLLLTLSSRPKLIFFDEILSGLDQASIQDLFLFFKENIIDKITTLTISHNPEEIFNICNRVLFLSKGEIVLNKKISEFKNIKELEDEMKKFIIMENKIDYDKLIKTKKKFEFSDEKIASLKNIKKTFGLNEVLTGEKNEGISFDIKKSETISLIGKNGSGKSTLVEIISGTRKQSSGIITTNISYSDSFYTKKIKKLDNKIEKNNLHISSLEEIIAKESDEAKINFLKTKTNKLKLKNGLMNDKKNKFFEKDIRLQNKKRGSIIGIQFQKQFYPRLLNLRDVVKYNLMANNVEFNEEYIEFILKSIDLEKHMYNSTYELSGGQRQKLNVILSIIKKPPILILDELTTGLDLLAKEKLLSLIKEYLKRTDSTLLMVTHSEEDILTLSKKILVLEKGLISKELLIGKDIQKNEIKNLLLNL